MQLAPEDLADMAVFAAVARARSYTGAAGDLGISKSAASKAVTRLEARVGTRLLQRTTRSVAPTEAGRALEARAAEMVAQASAGAEAAATYAAGPLGTLRVNGPVTFGEMYLAPALATLLVRHPGLRVELVLDDRLVDAGAGGWDVVVRIGPLAESTLAVRKLARDRRVVVASPEYLDRRGRPRTPADLRDHACVHYLNVSRAAEWRFRGPRGGAAVATRGPLESNNGLALRAAVLGGAGIAVFPEFMVAPELQAGTLVELLAEYALPSRTAIHALFARTRPVPPKVRAFLDHVSEQVRLAGLAGAGGAGRGR